MRHTITAARLASVSLLSAALWANPASAQTSVINIDFGNNSTYNGVGQLGGAADTLWNAVGTSGSPSLAVANGAGNSGLSLTLNGGWSSFANGLQANPLLIDWIYTSNWLPGTLTVSGLAPNEKVDIAVYEGFYWMDFTVPAQPDLVAFARPVYQQGSAAAPPFPTNTVGVLKGVVADASGAITIRASHSNLSGGFGGTPSVSISGMQILRGAAQAQVAVNPATGKAYEFVASYGLSWTEAKAAAEARTYANVQGRLAIITSQSDNDFIYNSFRSAIAASWAPPNDGYRQVFAGGYSPTRSTDPVAGWNWISAEPWSYTNWRPGEPNDGFDPNVPSVLTLNFYDRPGEFSEQWNDTPQNYRGAEGYIVEYPNPNTAPTANAGTDQSIRAGSIVTLDGGASFDDNTSPAALLYAWSFVSKPAGSTATLTAGLTAATPSFVADQPGTYVLGLVVTDEGGLASATRDEVVISSDNQAPTANAGADQMVVVFNTVSLNGSSSTDPENDSLTYAWTVSGPAGSTAVLNGPDTATPNFAPDVPGVYTMTLNVSDFLGAGAPDTVEVTAITAAAYAEQKIMCGANLIAGLGPNQVTTKGNQNALGNFLSQAVKAVQKGNNATAIFKLNEAIARTNGCEVNPGPSPDGNGAGRDWVTDCGVQPPILACLRSARDALTP